MLGLSGTAAASGKIAFAPDIEHVLLPTDLSDNAYNGAPITVGSSTYYFGSPFARAVFSTDAIQFQVDGYTTIFADTPAASRVGVRVAGADVATVTPASDGAFSISVALSPGTKTVEVITGGHNKPSSTLMGTFLRAIVTPGGATFSIVHPTASPRLFIYGDSITAGFSATTPALQAWVQLVRESYPTSLMVDAWGSRSMWDDCANGSLRAAFVAQVAAQTPAKIWLAIGSNDWSTTKWTAANFAIAYAVLLDDLHTALPSALIYCQSPIVRSGTTNGNGETLANFRTQISNSASARSGYCTHIDGAAILTLGDLADGTHPTTAGHVIYANSVKATLGI